MYSNSRTTFVTPLVVRAMSRRVGRFLLFHQTHQVDRAVLRDDLDVHRVEFPAVHETRLDLGRRHRVVRPGGERRDRADGELVLHGAHLLDGLRDAAGLLFRRRIGHFPGEQHRAVVARDVDVDVAFHAVADARGSLRFYALILRYRADGAAVFADHVAGGHGPAHHQRGAAANERQAGERAASSSDAKPRCEARTGSNHASFHPE